MNKLINLKQNRILAKIKGLMKKKSLLVIMLLMLIILISFAIDAYIRIKSSDTTSYYCEELKYENISISGNDTLIVNLTTRSNKIKTYNIHCEIDKGFIGTVDFVLYDKDNNDIWKSKHTISELTSKDSILLKLNQINLIKDKNYTLEIKSGNSANIMFFIGKNNELKNTQEFSNIHINVFRIIVTFIVVLSILLVILLTLKRFKVENVLIILGLIIGVLGIVLVPPYSQPDELRHFARAYQIVEGEVQVKNFSEPNYYWPGAPSIAVTELPLELSNIKLIDRSNSESYAGETNYKIFFDKWLELFNTDWSGETVTTTLQGTAQISPVAYIPQSLFISIAKFFSLPPIWIYFFAKLGNVVFSIAILFMALKITPTFKNCFFLLCFLPNVIIARSSCSTDSFLFAMVMLLISYLLYLKDKKILICNIRVCMILFLILFIIASIKLPYIVIGLLFLTLNDSNEKKREKSLFIKQIAILGSLLLMVYISYSFVASIITEYFPSTRSYGGHITYFMKNFISVSNLIFQYLINNISNIMLGAIGYLGVFYILILVINLLNSPDKFEIDKKLRYITLIIATILLLALVFVGFTFGAPNLGYISGLQARYFIPVIPLLLMAIPRNKYSYTDIATINVSFCIIFSFLTLLNVFTTTWI